MNRLSAIAAVFSLSSAADDAMPTLWELLDELFALDLGDYDHLSFSQSTLIGMRGIIIALFVGAIIGSVSALFNKRVLGGFVRALIAEGCTSPDKAKTLAELGFLKNTAVRASLRAGSVLGKTVRCVEEDEYNAATVAKRGIYELRAAESGKDIPPFREIPYKRDTTFLHPVRQVRQRGDQIQQKRHRYSHVHTRRDRVGCPAHTCSAPAARSFAAA